MNEPNPGAATAAATTSPSAQERQWAMFAHLSTLLGGVLTFGWAASVGFFVGPLIIWLTKRDTMPFVADQAKEALNFAITISLGCLVLGMLTLLTVFVGLLVTLPLFVIIAIGALVLVIIAAIKASEGVAYRYPFSLRLIK